MKFLSLFVSFFLCIQLNGQEAPKKIKHRLSVGHEILYFNDHRKLLSTEFYWKPRISILFENIRALEYELTLKENEIGFFLNYSTFHWGVPINNPPPANKFINSTFYFYRLGVSKTKTANDFSLSYRGGLSVRFGAEGYSFGYFINSFEIASVTYNGFLIGPFVSVKPHFSLTKHFGLFTEIGANYYLKRVHKSQTRIIGFGQLGLTYSFQFKKGKEEEN